MGLARRSRAPRRVRLEASAWTSLGVLAALLAVLASADVDGSFAAASPPRQLSAYPDDLLIDRPYDEASNRWLIFFHIIGIAYMLLGLNTVCDIYFCGALEIIVERWNVKPDVAGATFMAAGGSAPELFTSLLGTLVTQNDIGFGTIVGSAIFNVLFVIGLCGWVAKDEIKLTWWPLFRDCTCYMIGLACLAWVASDELVKLWEAVMLFLMYVLYCILMYNNGRLEALCKQDLCRTSKKPAEPGEVTSRFVAVKPSPKHEQVCPTASFIERVPCAWGEADDKESRCPRPGGCRFSDAGLESLEESELQANGGPEAGSDRRSIVMEALTSIVSGGSQGCEDDAPASAVKAQDPESCWHEEQQPPQGVEQTAAMPEGPPEEEEVEKAEEAEDEDAAADSLLACPTGGLKDKIRWCLCLPVYVPLYFLTPSSPDWYLATFGLSLVWIAFFSFFMVWWVEILGEVCHIDPIIMGYTLLAAGTSIPDAVSSVAVARLGKGDMSVSSSIGSNIFDILVGLPIPWIIKLVIDLCVGRTSEVRILTPYLTFFVLLLLFMVFAVVVIIHLIGWRLSRTLAVFMALLYVVFLAAGMAVEFTNPSWLRF